MFKNISSVLLTVFSVVAFLGIMLFGYVYMQYHLETPTAKEMRTQIDRIYNEITETELNDAREKAAESDDTKKFVINEIESERNLYLEISAYQNGREYNNACKIVAKKFDIILGDINTGKIDELKAYAAMIKIINEKEDFKNIDDVPFAEEFDFLATLLQLFVLSVALIIFGAIGVIVTFLCKRRKRVAPPTTE